MKNKEKLLNWLPDPDDCKPNQEALLLPFRVGSRYVYTNRHVLINSAWLAPVTPNAFRFISDYHPVIEENFKIMLNTHNKVFKPINHKEIKKDCFLFSEEESVNFRTITEIKLSIVLGIYIQEKYFNLLAALNNPKICVYCGTGIAFKDDDGNFGIICGFNVVQ